MHFRAQASLPFIAGLDAQDSSMMYPVKSAARAPIQKTNTTEHSAIPLFMVDLPVGYASWPVLFGLRTGFILSFCMRPAKSSGFVAKGIPACVVLGFQGG